MSSGALLPGATLGCFGGGQLGRMFALAAARLGYRVHVYTPEAGSPAGLVSAREFVGEYGDLERVGEFARGVDALTFEFENVASEPIARLESLVRVRPGARALHITQQRLREKGFLRAHGFPTTDFVEVGSAAEAEPALIALGGDAVLKTAAFGYDGKGQARVRSAAELRAAFARVGAQACILERRVPFERELSVVVARGADGRTAVYPPAENAHRDHVLDVSLLPARLDLRVAREAQQLAVSIAVALDYVGVLCVELFECAGARLLVNELAPRPHNSGHATIDACACSQFEQQVRALAGLPLGSTELARPSALLNLLGDVWRAGEPDWAALLAIPGLRLHLYGKREPRARRKMGHLVCLADTPEQALAAVEAARALLAPAAAARSGEAR